jgi:uncharacterized membrane protein HdeD (DUF308 family)
MATNTLSQEVSKRTGWGIFMGVLTAIVGVVMIIYPAATAAVSTIFLGWGLIIAGGAQIVFALDSDTAGNFFLKLLLGILYGISGVALLLFPMTGVVTFTGLLGTMLIVEAILEAALAVEVPASEARLWFVLSAIASLLLGILILAQWPSSSTWAIGTMLGVAVVGNGISRIVVASTVRHEAGKLEQATKTT